MYAIRSYYVDAPIVDEVIEVINNLEHNLTIVDLHVWRVGKGKYACIIGLNSEDTVETKDIKEALSIHEELVHISIEIECLAK